MGCKPSSEVSPSLKMTTAPSGSPTKRKRAETPPPEPSSSDTLPDLLLTPASPQKKSRQSSSTSILSSSPPSIGPLSPSTPLTPPDLQPGLEGIDKKDLSVEKPVTPPDTLVRDGSNRDDTPPSPTPNRRNIDADALSITLGAIRLADADVETPEVVDPAPLSSVSPDDYRIDFGPHQGYSIQQLPKLYRAQISDNDNLLESSPGLREALAAWASRWQLGYGRYAGKRLEDVPLYYINEFIIRTDKHLESGQEDLYAALKFHLLVRELEEPGSNYVFTFGKHRGDSLDDLPGQSYITWMKNKGIPCQSGYEDLAEAIECLHRRELTEFVLAHPKAATYTMPNEFEGWEGKPFVEFSEAAMRVVTDSRIHMRRDVDGFYVYPGMKDAVAYWWLVFNTNRWNWRRDRDANTGEYCCYPPDMDGNLLFPPSDVREATYTGY